MKKALILLSLYFISFSIMSQNKKDFKISSYYLGGTGKWNSDKSTPFIGFNHESAYDNGIEGNITYYFTDKLGLSVGFGLNEFNEK